MSAKIHNQTNSVRAFQSLRSKSRRNMRGQHVSRIEGSIKIHFQHSAFWRPPTFNPNKAIRNLFLRQRPLEVKRGFLGMKKQ
ncbi:hypothetical protein V6Z12_D02G170900 [Gossypium hirsutum]